MLVIEFGTEGTIEMVWVCRDGYQQLQALAISHRHRFADGNQGARAHNSCYHQIALVGEGWTCLVIQVLLLSEVAGGGDRGAQWAKITHFGSSRDS